MLYNISSLYVSFQFVYNNTIYNNIISMIYNNVNKLHASPSLISPIQLLNYSSISSAEQ